MSLSSSIHLSVPLFFSAVGGFLVRKSFNGCLREVSKVSWVFQKCFDKVLVLKFCWCMELIAATQAEGGLVEFNRGK